VGELVAELAPLVLDKRVRDVQALPPRDLLLVLEGDGEGERPLRLLLSADPDGPRLHLLHVSTGAYRSETPNSTSRRADAPLGIDSPGVKAARIAGPGEDVGTRYSPRQDIGTPWLANSAAISVRYCPATAFLRLEANRGQRAKAWLSGGGSQKL
jgi:hypothetical protein